MSSALICLKSVTWLHTRSAGAFNNELNSISVHSEGGSTYCPGCGCAVAVRDWYRMLRYELTEAGACVACGTLVAGVYDGPAGHWGARRLPLFIGG